MKINTWLPFVFAMILLFGLPACSDSSNTDLSKESEDEAPEVVRVYVASVGTESLPYYSWPENKERPTGLEPRLIEYVLSQAGLDFEYVVDYEYEGVGDPRILAVSSGKADVSIRGITINDERAQKVLFSDPYYTDGLGVMVLQSSDLFELEDLKGKNVFAYRYSTSFKWAEENLKGSNLLSTKEFGLKTSPLQLLEIGEVDAILTDYSALKRSQARIKNTRLFPRKYTVENFGIAISKSRPDLKEKIDKVLSEMRESGRLADFTSGFEKSN